MPGVAEQVQAPNGQLGQAAPQPFASADVFGSGIGAALSGAGEVLQDSNLRAVRAEKQRQEESDNATAGVGAAQLSVNLNQMAQGARDQAPLDGSGHAETVAAGADQLVGDYLATIKDPKVRERWAAHAAELKGGLVSQEDGWQRGRRIEAIGTNVRDAGRLWDDQLQGHPDPQAFSDALGNVDTLLAGTEAPADVKQKLAQEQKASRAENYGRGLVEQDPAAALHVLESGALDTWLDPNAKKVLVNDAETGIRVADADQRRQVAQQAAQVRVDATALTAKIGQGVLVGDDELAGVVKRAQALTVADPGLGNVAESLQYDEGKLKYSRLTDKWTPAEWDQAIVPLAAKVATGKASEDDQRELKILDELRPAKEARFKSDPDGFSAASGIVPPQVDIANPDADSVEARKSWARAFARQGGLVEPPYLNKDQLTEYRDRAAQGPAAQFEIAQTIKQTWGDAAPSVVRQIGGAGAGDMKIMLGLNPAIAQRYKRGQQALDNKAVELDDNVGRQVFGAYVRGLPSDLQAPLFDAARKIAAGWMLDKGFTKVPANYDQVFGAALQYAAGRTGDVNDFHSPGGLAELNGRYAWLPADMSSNDFLHRVARAGPSDWVNAATDSQGNPVKSVPHYLGPDGRPKPYTKGDALRFGKGTLQSLDAGLYHLLDPMGHVAVDERGQPWTFDVRRLPR